MSRSFQLPDLGEGVHEGEVLAVRVSVGQSVKEGDIILEVETDKAAVEIPSPYTGTITEILVKQGDIVNVGDVMMAFSDGGQVQAAVPSSDKEEKRAPKAMDKAPVETRAASATPEPKQRGPVSASPATRRLARELGVDLHLVVPSGPGGLVTADDVRAFSADTEKEKALETAEPKATPAERAVVAAAAPPLPDFSHWGPIERQPFRSIRRATANQMALAWSQIPHVTSQDTVDITGLEAFRQKHKGDIEAAGGRLTLTVFAIKAVATALKAYPQFNASLDLDAQEIILKNYFHIGVAVDTESGLIVPVIRDVDRKSIREIAIEMHDMVERTRQRKVSRDELQGGTFTITNAGATGGGFFTPIINYPQIAILGMGRGRLQPAVVKKGDGNPVIEPRLIMPIVLCIDHRVVDGADAIRFLKVVINALEDTDELLMTMV